VFEKIVEFVRLAVSCAKVYIADEYTAVGLLHIIFTPKIVTVVLHTRKNLPKQV
jgi:hypothetical protein